MATAHTPLPTKHAGEREVALQLSNMADEKLHVWFNLEFIPHVRDIDLLIWHEQIGVFVVEIKAVPLRVIQRFGFDRCVIGDGRTSDKSPQVQAYDAYESLRNYLRPKMKNRPFIVPTACWPKISRAQWNVHWDDSNITGEFADRILFEEDLTGGPETLRDRLRYIWSHPPVRDGSDREFKHSQRMFDEFVRQLSPVGRPSIAPSDYQRLLVLEKAVEESALAEAPASRTVRVLYRGHPGTGKTFRLLRVGLNHVFAGRRVLFLCFNKVLASDVRRLVSHSERLRAATGAFEAFDAYEVLSRYANLYGIVGLEEDYDGWAQLIVEEMARRPEALDKYDTVLIDEAQDLPNWAFRMAELHSVPSTSFCVAAGAGQELYGGASEWLERFRDTAVAKELRRNFRNTKPTFQVAQIFYEKNRKGGKAEVVLRHSLDRPKSNQVELGFERLEGRPHEVRYLDEHHYLELADTDPLYGIVQDETMFAEYKRIVEAQIERLQDDERPIDILLLVPSENSPEHKWALGALALLPDVSFIDYTPKENRRSIARPEMVRLCTYHSARGIEANRVVLFGFEHFSRLASRTSVHPANLGYIVLSRSLFECVLAVRPSRRSVDIRSIEEIIAEVQTAQRAIAPLPSLPS